MHRAEVGPASRWGDDTGALAFALLVTLVGISLTALLVPMVVTQIQSTRAENRRVVALSAAQAGLDVALGHIQAANDGTGTGVLASLPCGPLTGDVGAAGTGRYQVSIAYYGGDPRGHEQDSTWQAANPPISCISGGGTYSTPAYALLRSLGTDQATGSFTSVPVRSLAATYVFQLTNQNIPGGLIRRWNQSLDLCFDAGSSSPAAGTNLQMQICVEGSSRQTFAYSPNLSLVLVASRSPSNPNGMCVDGGSPEVVGAVVTLQPCVSPKTNRQQWSFNDNARVQGTSDGKTLNNVCLDAKTANTAGSFVVLSDISTCPAVFAPEPSAGAGAAGPATGQVVNYAQFGRCLDITNQDVTWPHEMVWPCKQAPDPTTLTWNQVFSIPAVPANGTSASGPISTTTSGTVYCLKSPNSTTAYTYYPTVAACGSGPTADEVWTVYGDTGDYTTSYRIMDKNGYCLAPTDPDALNPDLWPYGVKTSKIIVAVCSSSAVQKWNVPPNLQSLPLANIREN